MINDYKQTREIIVYLKCSCKVSYCIVYTESRSCRVCVVEYWRTNCIREVQSTVLCTLFSLSCVRAPMALAAMTNCFCSWLLRVRSAFNESARGAENASDWQSICLHRPANVSALLAASAPEVPGGGRCADISTLPVSLIGNYPYSACTVQYSHWLSKYCSQNASHSQNVRVRVRVLCVQNSPLKYV